MEKLHLQAVNWEQRLRDSIIVVLALSSSASLMFTFLPSSPVGRVLLLTLLPLVGRRVVETVSYLAKEYLEAQSVSTACGQELWDSIRLDVVGLVSSLRSGLIPSLSPKWAVSLSVPYCLVLWEWWRVTLSWLLLCIFYSYFYTKTRHCSLSLAFLSSCEVVLCMDKLWYLRRERVKEHLSHHLFPNVYCT